MFFVFKQKTAYEMRISDWSSDVCSSDLLAIRAAAADSGLKRLTQADLYVTLEPCPMCAAAIGFARLRRLVYGAYDPKGGGVDHGPRLFQRPTCHHHPHVVGGVQEPA